MVIEIGAIRKLGC